MATPCLKRLSTKLPISEAQNQLIADVLDVSRIVSGKMRLSVDSVDLSRLAADACDSVRPAAEAKGITLRQAIERPSLWVSADPDRVQQILWNLLSNAIKFTPRGGEVRLEVAITDSRARISVVDTGIGIPADFLPLRRVRALSPERGGEVAALAVTAYGRPQDRLRALAAGYQQHLAKPVMPGELVVVAASLFRRPSGQVRTQPS
jgi:hypothetical protein